MLDEIYYENTPKSWMISVLIIVGAFFLNYIMKLIINKIIRKIMTKSKMRIGNVFLDALEKPLYMGIILFAAWVAAIRLNMSKEFHKIIIISYTILIALVITWFFSRLFIYMLEYSAKKYESEDKSKFSIDPKLLPLAKRAIIITVWLLGVITILNAIGLNLTTLLGTLGIGGIAFAFAAQDTIKNIFGGVTIFTNSIFRIGDVIKFDNTEGTVIDIGLRSTKISTYNRQIVIIPNYKLTDASITNISSEPGRRIVTKLGLTYDTSAEKMREAIDILKKIPENVTEIFEKDLTAVFTDFGDSDLTITFIYFIKPQAIINETRSKVNFEILREFNRAGLNFAFPSQTLYIAENKKN